MSIIANPTDLYTRYMTIVLKIDDAQFPNIATSQTTVPQAFASTGNTVKVITANSVETGLAVEATINKVNGIQQCNADVMIKGLEFADIIAFSYFNTNSLFQFSKNTITIYAGYQLEQNGYPPLVYGPGQVMLAPANFNDPSRPFYIKSVMALYYQNQPTTTYSIKGTIALNSMFQQMTNNIDSNLIYQGFNINGTATNPVYIGSAWEQLKDATTHYGYQMQLDNNIIKIAPANSAYSSNTVIMNADNGMLGYPIPNISGCNVRCRFNPNIQFGDTVQLTSYYTTLNNNVQAGYPAWYINGMTHTLQNQGNKWESALSLNAYPFQIAI